MPAASATAKVVAVVSGGVDSISYMAQYVSKGYEVHPLFFNYGHKGVKEVVAVLELCKSLKTAEPIVIDLRSLSRIWRGTQLVDKEVAIKEKYAPSVVVPLRNAVFLTIAAAYAISIGAEYVIYGSHLDDVKPREDVDEPMYPDCSPTFARALESALNLGHSMLEARIKIMSPAIEGLSKAENLRRGYEVLGDLIFKTWSCYTSGPAHCGRCESDINRHRAFIEAGIPDKTDYETHPVVSEKCLSRACGFKARQ